jgi:uncharacterized membrane protein YfcA
VTPDPALLLLAAAGFVAYVVRGLTGAASAVVFNALFAVLLAVGLTGGLTLLDGLYWIALGDLFAGIVLAIILRAELRLEPFMTRLLLSSIPVSVAFTLLLPRVNVDVLAVGLGLSLLGSGLYLGLRRELAVWDALRLERMAVPTGLLAGLLSGLYGMAGPASVMFLSHAGSDPRRFRARTTLISLAWSSVRVGTLAVSGAVGPPELERLGATLPIILRGLAVGLWLHPQVGARAFRSGLGGIVALAGIVLIARQFAG